MKTTITALIALVLLVAAGWNTSAFADEGVVQTADAAEVEQFIQFDIMHADASKGPVTGRFGEFTLKNAVVNLEQPAESRAEFEINIGSMNTGIEQRDAHLATPDYFNVPVHPTATLIVDNVRAGADADNFNATAHLSLMGQTKEFEVSFKVVERREDGSIVIEAKQNINRSDYGVGGAPETSGAVDLVEVSVRLHLANT